MSKKAKLPDLESSLKEITSLIEDMEKGEFSLEQSLNRFERGIILIKHAQKLLEEAEHKVQILLQQDNEDKLDDYESNT